MDFNDIKKRMEIITVSLQYKLERDVENNVKAISSQEGGNSIIDVKFGSQTEGELETKIWSIVSNLAALKDPLKNAANKNGVPKKMIFGKLKHELEDLIDSSLAMKVVLDLNNQYKHGSPLKTPRTNLEPKIVNIKEALQMKAKKEYPPGSPPPSFAELMRHASKLSLDLSTGKFESDGNNLLVITADVIDKFGNVIFSLDKMIEECLGNYEAFITKYSLT